VGHSTFKIPALSPELSFYLRHADECEEIAKNAERYLRHFDTDLPLAFEKVYERAYKDLRDLIEGVAEAISNRIAKHATIVWKTQNIEGDWGVWGHPRRPRGRLNQNRWAGIYVDCVPGIPRLYLVIAPERGGNRLLIEQCRKKWTGQLILTEDSPRDWPGWDKYPCVVFFSEELSAKTSMKAIKEAASKAAEGFLKVAMSILSK
jgi:hypothetical protein